MKRCIVVTDIVKQIFEGCNMAISENRIYPRTGDTETFLVKNVITNPDIEIGDYTMYNDFAHNPCDFQKNNVLYHSRSIMTDL